MARRESNLQKSCVLWFAYEYPLLRGLLFSVPNGAFLQGNKMQRIKQWQKLAAEGAVKGVSDLILMIPNKTHHALCIEVKTMNPKTYQSKEQKQWERMVTAKGYKYVVVRSVDEFILEITKYIKKF